MRWRGACQTQVIRRHTLLRRRLSSYCAAPPPGARSFPRRIGGCSGAEPLSWRRRRKGEVHAAPITILVSGSARGLPAHLGAGAGPGNSLQRKFRSGPVAGGQPPAVRERGAAECGRAEPGRALRYMEQPANKEPRLLDDTKGIPVGWYGVPLGAPSHRRSTAPSS